MNKYIDFNQLIVKSDDSEITEAEMESLIDDILDVIEEHGFVTGGGYGLLTEEDVEKRFE